MAEEDMFFAGPPSNDEPIVLGPPSDDPFGEGGYQDFSAPPAGDFAGTGDFASPGDDFGGSGDDAAYLGEVNEGGDAPIILGPSDDELLEPAAEIVPTGPTPMQIWNDEWQELLKQRKDEENSRKAELIETARIALEEFQVEREQRREASMAKNREDEQAKLEAIEADLENDNSWQKVCKMIELSHDNSADSKDVKRMRDTLIYLKNEPAKASLLSS